MSAVAELEELLNQAGYAHRRTVVPEGVLISVLIRPEAVEPAPSDESEAESGAHPLPHLPAGARVCSRFWVVCDAQPAQRSGVWGGLAKSEFFVLRRETRAARYLAFENWHAAVAEWRALTGNTTAVPPFRRVDALESQADQ